MSIQDNEMDFLDLPVFPIVRSARCLKLDHHNSSNDDDSDIDSDNDEEADTEHASRSRQKSQKQKAENGNDKECRPVFRVSARATKSKSNRPRQGCLDACLLSSRKKEPQPLFVSIRSRHAKKIQDLIDTASRRETATSTLEEDTGEGNVLAGSASANPPADVFRSPHQSLLEGEEDLDSTSNNSPSPTLLLVSKEESDFTKLVQRAAASAPTKSALQFLESNDCYNNNNNNKKSTMVVVGAEDKPDHETMSNTTTGSQDDVLIEPSSRALGPAGKTMTTEANPLPKCPKCLVVGKAIRFSCARCCNSRSSRGMCEV